jgi:ABC-type spermidine/putrescine transport system permease subunit II
MAVARSEPRKRGFWPLAILFAAFVLFLYGPVITIFVLSFQGPEGGLTFPMRGLSLHWYPSSGKGWASSTSAPRCAARSRSARR